MIHMIQLVFGAYHRRFGLRVTRKANNIRLFPSRRSSVLRGASPGERRGGRAVGTPNKFGEQRAVAVEREGKRLPAANLLIIVENSMAMAARYQPGRADAPNPVHNEERYAFWLNRAREALS